MDMSNTCLIKTRATLNAAQNSNVFCTIHTIDFNAIFIMKVVNSINHTITNWIKFALAVCFFLILLKEHIKKINSLQIECVFKMKHTTNDIIHSFIHWFVHSFICLLFTKYPMATIFSSCLLQFYIHTPVVHRTLFLTWNPTSERTWYGANTQILRFVLFLYFTIKIWLYGASYDTVNCWKVIV